MFMAHMQAWEVDGLACFYLSYPSCLSFLSAKTCLLKPENHSTAKPQHKPFNRDGPKGRQIQIPETHHEPLHKTPAART